MYDKLKLLEDFEWSLTNFFNEKYVNTDVKKILEDTEYEVNKPINESSNNQVRKAINDINKELDYDDFEEDFDGDGEDDIDPDELDDLFLGVGDDPEIEELADEEELDDIEDKRLKEEYDPFDDLLDYFMEDVDPMDNTEFEIIDDLSDYSFNEGYYAREKINYDDEDFDMFDDFDDDDDDIDYE